MKKISRVNLKGKIREAGNKIFSVEFIKLDGSPRKMVARLGVKTGLRGGLNKVEAEDRPYLTVFDMQKKAYRTVNLDTVSRLKIGGKEYEVV